MDGGPGPKDNLTNQSETAGSLIKKQFQCLKYHGRFFQKPQNIHSKYHKHIYE